MSWLCQVDGKIVPLDEETGTNILGELIEASEWSANKLLYGDMHNFGHMAICYIHDPDRSHFVRKLNCHDVARTSFR